MIDILVVGSGLSGLFASIIATKKGARVTLAANGNGGLSISHGCIDVWSKATPSRVLTRLKKGHPYSLAGKGSLVEAVNILEVIAAEAGYPYSGSLKKNLLLPTSFGTLHTTSLAPSSMARFHTNAKSMHTIAGIIGLRDFFPTMLARNLARSGIPVAGAIHLPLPGQTPRRDLYAPDIAHMFEDQAFRQEIVRQWKPLLSNVKCLGLPAVLGIHPSNQIFEQLEELLGVPLFEIPTLPPSVPGLRLENMLRMQAVKSGVDFIQGSPAIGRVDGRSKNRRVAGIALQSAGGNRGLFANMVILATGGFLNGGLVARQDGSIHESVFDLPVEYSHGRNQWINSSFFDAQPYATFGLPVNTHMQPLGADGDPIYENLFAAGGIIAGSDRQREGSRQGIDLATAYRAVEAALG